MNNEDIEFLETINRYIYKRMSAYMRHHPEWEDAVQEAYIRAWKDYEAGNWESDFHLVNRACTWAKAYLQEDRGGGRRATGRPRSESSGRVQAEGLKMAEKTKQYVDEFHKLHKRKPRPMELRDALGITDGYASILLKNYNQTIYAAKAGIRDAWAPAVGMDTIRAESNEDEKKSKSFIKSIRQENFEDDVLSDLHFDHIVSSLKPRHKEVLNMYFRYGMTTREIGDYYGYEKYPVKNARANILSALKAARKIVEAEHASTEG